MRKKYVQLDRREYGRKEARELLCSILNGYALGETVSSRDHRVLRDALSYHPNAPEKIGCGIKRFTIEPDAFHGRCFVVERVDGSRTDFSYIKALTNTEDPHRQRVLGAFRHAVFDQTFGFKKRAFGGGTRKYVRCEITGLNMQIRDCHVDHAPPLTFNVLVFDFLRSCHLRIEDVGATSCGTTVTLDDSELSRAWQEYHKKHAVLRTVLDHANLGQKKTPVNWEGLESAPSIT